jgi:hypothetical protein
MRRPNVLADDFFRLAHHDVTGQPRLSVAARGLGLAAAVLGELAFARRLVVRGGSVVVCAGAALADPLAHAVLNQITADVAQDRALADVRVRLEGLRRDAYMQVAHRLWQTRAVERVESGFRLWGRRPVLWVPTDMNRAAWPWARLSTRLRAGERLDEFDSVLAGLANATGLGWLLLDDAAPGAHDYLERLVATPHPELGDLLAHTKAAVGDAVLAYRA